MFIFILQWITIPKKSFNIINHYDGFVPPWLLYQWFPNCTNCTVRTFFEDLKKVFFSVTYLTRKLKYTEETSTENYRRLVACCLTMLCSIIPQVPCQGFLNHDIIKPQMKKQQNFWYDVELIKLYIVKKFHSGVWLLLWSKDPGMEPVGIKTVRCLFNNKANTKQLFFLYIHLKLV